jgi:L-cysteine desulfidase
VKLESKDYQLILKLLHGELIPAMGCTEPAAVAYAANLARTTLGVLPDHVIVRCSGNIVKNVKGVVIPNSGGLKGIEASCILGIMAPENGQGLEVLNDLEEGAISKAKELIASGYCEMFVTLDQGPLYIEVEAFSSGQQSRAVIKDGHTNIILIEKNGDAIFTGENLKKGTKNADKSLEVELSIKNILSFADELRVEDVEVLLENQISVNMKISQEGLDREYGQGVGRSVLSDYPDHVMIRAKAKAAAGVDARMGGSPMAVIINSGSGNQGITVSVPLAEYAWTLGSSKEDLYRALAVSNLVSIHIKRQIGKLSAFCGAVSAACGAGAGITYLKGGDYHEICASIINTAANVGGIFCDGAKASCAAKVASSVDAAILGSNMALQGRVFSFGEGILGKDIESTIRNIGKVASEGMLETDKSIIDLMTCP